MAYNKLHSRRFWITLWAIATSTGIMGLSLWKQYDPSWMAPTLTFLVGVIGAYVSIESWNKPKMKG